MNADEFEKRIGLRRDGTKLTDPRPENPTLAVGGELTPYGVMIAAEVRAASALADYRRAGASRAQVWRLAQNVLDDNETPEGVDP